MRPTVPNADTTSKSILIKGILELIMVSINVTIPINAIEMRIVTKDNCMYLSDISLLNIELFFSLRIVLKIAIVAITKVVTYIPPAALNGAPPINMRAISNKAVGVLMFPTSIVLNPAVLVVTDWKNAFPIFSINPMCNIEF